MVRRSPLAQTTIAPAAPTSADNDATQPDEPDRQCRAGMVNTSASAPRNELATGSCGIDHPVGDEQKNDGGRGQAQGVHGQQARTGQRRDRERHEARRRPDGAGHATVRRGDARQQQQPGHRQQRPQDREQPADPADGAASGRPADEGADGGTEHHQPGDQWQPRRRDDQERLRQEDRARVPAAQPREEHHPDPLREPVRDLRDDRPQRVLPGRVTGQVVAGQQHVEVGQHGETEQPGRRPAHRPDLLAHPVARRPAVHTATRSARRPRSRPRPCRRSPPSASRPPAAPPRRRGSSTCRTPPWRRRIGRSVPTPAGSRRRRRPRCGRPAARPARRVRAGR